MSNNSEENYESVNNVFVYRIIVLLQCFALSAAETTFQWRGTVPRLASEMEQPVNGDQVNIDKLLSNNPVLMVDKSQAGFYDNDYGIVNILTVIM
ncbi:MULTISPECIES: hypothetical protein [Photobacterium]|uniref:hypothetical protein n=1 Tax=Photobacterium TaxID=657 RepID=UPI00118271D5|nr:MULTISPECIES: hypothetical protein [Photobacterium]